MFFAGNNKGAMQGLRLPSVSSLGVVAGFEIENASKMPAVSGRLVDVFPWTLKPFYWKPKLGQLIVDRQCRYDGDEIGWHCSLSREAQDSPPGTSRHEQPRCNLLAKRPRVFYASLS